VPTDKRQRQKEGQRARREAALAAARRRQRRQRLILSIVLAAIVIGLISIVSIVGGDDNKDEKSSASSTSTTSKPPTTMPKPAIDVPTDPAPTELETKDLKVGTGKTAKLGDTIEVNYVGATYADGKEFEASWDSNRTATFPLNEGGLIEGWVKGIPGMKVGGRRELVIPSAMAYGDNPSSGQPAGALIFIVDLVAIK
jgi:peptidylprolyl isomerase